MPNATIQNLFSTPPVYSGVGSVSGYRQYGLDSSEFNVYGGYGHWLQNDNTYASEIWHEAQRFDVLTDAYNEHATRLADTLNDSVDAEISMAADPDTEAAFVQAELLGASADQRAKLRAIVTARINAERALTESTRQLADMRQQLAVANEDILDGHDPRTMQLFANTGAVADKQGLCSVYDQIARDSLIPTRPELAQAGYVGEGSETDYYVSVTVQISVQTSVSVTARSESEAAEQVDEMSHHDIWGNIDLGNTSYYDIESFETGDVEEAD